MDLLNLREASRNVLRQSKPPPRHPARKNDIDHHEGPLRWREYEDVSRFVGNTVVRKFENMTSDLEFVLVLESDGGNRAIGIIRALQKPLGFLMRDDDRFCTQIFGRGDVINVRVAVNQMGD